MAELRLAIASGDLRPGEQVLQDALAERFGVSRVPLREALKILEGEGQVVYRPHRGYFVAELDLDDLREVYRIRDLLESEAVRVAVPQINRRAAAPGWRPPWRTSSTPRPPATSSPWPTPTGGSTSA